jgi:hypothetical protein
MASSLEKQIIARALEIISTEQHWTRETWARTSSHQPCTWSDSTAVKFCAVGALNRAAMEVVKGWGCSRAIEAEELIMIANDRVGEGLPKINDDEGHEVVVAMFRTALGR